MSDHEKTTTVDSETDAPSVASTPPDSAPNMDAGLDPAMAAQLDELMKKLSRAEELERELGEWKTRYVRLQQDLESYRNRTANDAAEAKTTGEANAVEKMLGTYDDVSRAIDAGAKDPSTLIPGLGRVRDNFLKNLMALGCETVGGVGSDFDPNLHEAIGVVAGPEDDKIAEVFQTGFVLRGKLVRPARVMVSRRGH